MIRIASSSRSILSLSEGHSYPTGISFIASPDPTPKNIRLGNIARKLANACAVIAGLYLNSGQVTAVPKLILFVLAAAAPMKTHVLLSCAPVCDHG